MIFIIQTFYDTFVKLSPIKVWRRFLSIINHDPGQISVALVNLKTYGWGSKEVPL